MKEVAEKEKQRDLKNKKRSKIPKKNMQGKNENARSPRRLEYEPIPSTSRYDNQSSSLASPIRLRNQNIIRSGTFVLVRLPYTKRKEKNQKIIRLTSEENWKKLVLACKYFESKKEFSPFSRHS